MEKWKLGIGLAASLLGAGCDAKVGEKDGSETGNSATTGKAEEGRMSIKADGVDLSIKIPEGVRNEIKADGDSRILPPGAALTGMHVQGGAEGKGGNVEMRFRVARPVQEVATWYRDPARAKDFAIRASATEGTTTAFSGTVREGDGDFTVRLAAEGAATQGRITLSGGS